jgi:MoxR-like ATPase
VKPEIEELIAGLDRIGYVAEREIATAVHLALRLGKPLLVEGAAGVGKTEVAKALASLLDAELIRLQCYEGLDVNTALYEWNYQKQLLRIRLEGDPGGSTSDIEETIFGPEYLLERPLLRAIRQERPAVLLIDEIDRADEEFEAFLLELLSDFQVSIPELGTVRAISRPHTVLTSNGTRELSDALRRRCLYLWIDYPTPEKELRILRARFPDFSPRLAEQTVQLVQRLRDERLSKTPGLAETIDFVAALRALDATRLDAGTVHDTLGCLLKDRHDAATLDEETLEALLAPAGEADAAGAASGACENRATPSPIDTDDA